MSTLAFLAFGSQQIGRKSVEGGERNEVNEASDTVWRSSRVQQQEREIIDE